jgi:hypothetical protein
MFNFFGSLFHKTIVLFVGLAASIGLVSATPQTTTIPTSSTPQIAVQQTSSTSSSSEVITTSPLPTSTIYIPPSPPIKKSSVIPPANPVAIPQTQSQITASPAPQITPQSSTTGTRYCDSYSGSTCISWGYSATPPPTLSSQFPNTYGTNQYAPPNAVSPAPSGNNNTASNSSQNIEELQKQYTQDIGIIQNTPGIGLSVQQGEENTLNQLYNAELQAAELNAPCFSPNLTLAGGEQGEEALENAMECADSVQ